jgi:serine/threonine-protein kinase HipA
MSDSRFDICIDWDGQTLEVGKLYANDRSAAVTFEYSEEWLNRHHAFAIDPDGLPLGRGRFAMAGLPRALADTGPDRWGRVIIERAVHPEIRPREWSPNPVHLGLDAARAAKRRAWQLHHSG